jgi:hypothetical protein
MHAMPTTKQHNSAGQHSPKHANNNRNSTQKQSPTYPIFRPIVVIDDRRSPRTFGSVATGVGSKLVRNGNCTENFSPKSFETNRNPSQLILNDFKYSE